MKDSDIKVSHQIAEKASQAFSTILKLASGTPVTSIQTFELEALIWLLQIEMDIRERES